MGLSTLDIGEKINRTEKARRFGQTVLAMKETMIWVENKATVSSNGLMALNMKATSETTV